MFGILVVAVFILSAVVVGVAWAWQRAAASFEMEIEIRKRAERQARATDRARSELLVNVRHQLRTSLAEIVDKADLLRAADLPVSERHQVEALDKSAEALLALADELFDSSKIEGSS